MTIDEAIRARHAVRACTDRKIDDDILEKLLMVTALGYGETNGVQHMLKAADQVSDISADSPEWFKKARNVGCLRLLP